MKVEFERLIGFEVPDEHYEIIELVYMYHPKDFSKKDVATLYKIGGIETFDGLVKVARKMKALQDERDELQRKLKKINKEISDLYHFYQE